MFDSPETNPKASYAEFLKQLRDYAEGTKSWGTCDKCHLAVPPGNNAAVFEFIRSLGHWENAFNLNRHLEPIADAEGRVICEGSPSRWQHISGMQDLRAEYRREGGQKEAAVAIWNLMQTLALPEIEPEKENY